MFFAGITKEQRADASRDDYLTKEKSHDEFNYSHNAPNDWNLRPSLNQTLR